MAKYFKIISSILLVALFMPVAWHSVFASDDLSVETLQSLNEALPGWQKADAVPQLQVSVEEVEGYAQFRSSVDRDFQALQLGDLPIDAQVPFKEGLSLRVGPRSRVRITMSGLAVGGVKRVTIARLGSIDIKELANYMLTGKNANRVRGAMKYGRSHYDIEAAGPEHESTIRPPSTTMGVRG